MEQPLTHAKLQAMSDVMEAAWGICHKSTPESKVMQEHLASESGVGAAEGDSTDLCFVWSVLSRPYGTRVEIP